MSSNAGARPPRTAEAPLAGMLVYGDLRNRRAVPSSSELAATYRNPPVPTPARLRSSSTSWPSHVIFPATKAVGGSFRGQLENKLRFEMSMPCTTPFSEASRNEIMWYHRSARPCVPAILHLTAFTMYTGPLEDALLVSQMANPETRYPISSYIHVPYSIPPPRLFLPWHVHVNILQERQRNPLHPSFPTRLLRCLHSLPTRCPAAEYSPATFQTSAAVPG